MADVQVEVLLSARDETPSVERARRNEKRGNEQEHNVTMAAAAHIPGRVGLVEGESARLTASMVARQAEGVAMARRAAAVKRGASYQRRLDQQLQHEHDENHQDGRAKGGHKVKRGTGDVDKVTCRDVGAALTKALATSGRLARIEVRCNRTRHVEHGGRDEPPTSYGVR